MIYMDNAATTLRKPPEVIEAVVNALQSFGNAGRGAHEASLDASRIMFDAREKLSDLFGAGNPKQIAFTMNSTASLNIAIKGLLEPGDHVVTTVLEHNSVLRPLYEMEARGVELTIINSDSKGNIRYEDVKEAIRSNTKAIICTGASNLTGNIVDLMKVGQIAADEQVLLIVDASQLAGVFPIDVEKMHIDVLCFTGHKGLLGPQGTGGIYVREGLDIKPLMSGGSGVQTYSRSHPPEMPARLEAGTLNGHGIAGLAAALTYLEKIGPDNIRRQEQKLMRQFYQGVRDISGIKVYGDFTTLKRCPIVTLNIGDYDSSEVSDQLLTDYHISTRPGAHCAPLMHKALGTVEQGAVRFSFSHYNTEAEITAAVEAVRCLAAE